LILLKLADPKRPIQDVTKDLVGTSISVKVIKFSLIVPWHHQFAVGCGYFCCNLLGGK